MYIKIDKNRNSYIKIESINTNKKNLEKQVLENEIKCLSTKLGSNHAEKKENTPNMTSSFSILKSITQDKDNLEDIAIPKLLPIEMPLFERNIEYEIEPISLLQRTSENISKIHRENQRAHLLVLFFLIFRVLKKEIMM